MVELQRTDARTAADEHYDVLVVGGGINGVAVARDAALRGLRTLVVERLDLGSGTSAWNSRLIHGGLRYLEHGEVRLVRESLSDRECLFRIAPHLVKPLGFVVPVYRHNKKPGWMFRVGMYLYDVLSYDKSVPWHRTISRTRARLELPGLSPDGLSRALHYYDGQVDYAERLVLETMMSAAAAGAKVMTYTEVTEILVEDGRATGARVRDRLDGTEVTVRASIVVNAAGPWVDDLAAPLGIEREIGGTKGTHLVVDPFPGAPSTAVYYEARSDNRAILVIPWNGRYLIGTTDDPFEGDLDTLAGTDAERDYLLQETNALIPGADLTSEDVLYTYAGVRPLPYRPGVAPGKIPRSHLLVVHPKVDRLITIVGGKLTPHLSLGREVVDKVGELLGRRLPASRARRRPLPGAHRDWESYAQELTARLPWEPQVNARLVKVYGRRAERLLDLVQRDPAAAEVIGEGRSAVVAGEVRLAVTEEAAVHLTDILHRRTMVGLEPGHATDIARRVADVAAPLLGWDAERVEREVAENERYVQRFAGGAGAHRAASPEPAAVAG